MSAFQLATDEEFCRTHRECNEGRPTKVLIAEIGMRAYSQTYDVTLLKPTDSMEERGRWAANGLRKQLGIYPMLKRTHVLHSVDCGANGS